MNFADLLVPALVTPAVLYIAMLAQRSAGPVSAGLVASLPIQQAIGAFGVSMAAGDQAVADFALVASTYLPAQVAYGVAFTFGMRKRGMLVAVTGATAAYALGIVILGQLPVAVAIAAGAVSLVVGFKVIQPDPQEIPALPPVKSNSGIVVALGTIGVLSVILLVQVAGPTAGAFMAAYPVITPILAYFLMREQGRGAGAQTMSGMVQGLPMYTVFVITLTLFATTLGTEFAVGIGMTLSLAIAAILMKFNNSRTAPSQLAVDLAA